MNKVTNFNHTHTKLLSLILNMNSLVLYMWRLELVAKFQRHMWYNLLPLPNKPISPLKGGTDLEIIALPV